MEVYPSLSPITDFCVMDLDRQGQGQIVACCGAFQEGSLRVVRSGIGINEQAQIELPGIKGMWGLRPSFGSTFDKFLVQSFVSETRVLAINNEVSLRHHHHQSGIVLTNLTSSSSPI